MLSQSTFSKWRRIVLWSTLVCVGLLAGGGFYSANVRAQSARKPLLIQSAIQTVQSDGSLKTSRYLTEATRGDGSWMKQAMLSADAAICQGIREIGSTPTKKVVSYDPATNKFISATMGNFSYSTNTSPVSPDCLKAHPGPGTATCAPSNLKVLGYPVWILSRQFTERSGLVVKVDDLVAPSLDWRSLQMTTYNNGEMVQKKTAVFLAEGEPAPGLFDISADATELSTLSEMAQTSEAKRGRHISQSALATLDQRQAVRSPH